MQPHRKSELSVSAREDSLHEWFATCEGNTCLENRCRSQTQLQSEGHRQRQNNYSEKNILIENLKEFEARRDELEKLAKTNLEIEQKRKEKLDGFKISITAEANDEGLLFGSIGPYEIEKQLLENGHEIERKEIRMPDGAIKKTGEYTIGIHLGIDTDAIINLIVETNN